MILKARFVKAVKVFVLHAYPPLNAISAKMDITLLKEVFAVNVEYRIARHALITQAVINATLVINY